MDEFEEIAPECEGTVNVTTFRFQGKIYTISTTEIMSLHAVQSIVDARAGYTGTLGNYETMLFINQDSMVYPFGDLPGHPGLGVFQRYDDEDTARDGHYTFMARVKHILAEKGDKLYLAGAITVNEVRVCRGILQSQGKDENMKWRRYRFYTRSVDDVRPLVFNPHYPWWHSGDAGDGSFASIVAY